MTTPLTNEQKIDEIYDMMRSERSSRSRGFWYRILKWLAILGIAYFTISNPGYVTGKIMGYLWPIVAEQVDTIVSNKKNWLIESVKKILPESDPQPQEQY